MDSVSRERHPPIDLMPPKPKGDSFTPFLDEHMTKPGRLLALLGLLERLRIQSDLIKEEHLSPNHAQLVDHNKFVTLGLERFGLVSPLTKFLRRASNVGAWIGPLFEYLRSRDYENFTPPQRDALLDELAAATSVRVQHINEAQPLIARFNRGTAEAIVGDLLDQAQTKNRAKDVAEYLIGAKLQMIFGEAIVRPKNVNTPSEHGDFQIGDVAIEVTINQPDKRHLDQISRLIEDTSLQIWLVVRLTDREKWRNAVDAAFESPQRQRILVTDVETYLCHNVTERGNFLATGTRDTLNRILDIYNDRWLPAAGAGGLRIVSGDPETD